MFLGLPPDARADDVSKFFEGYGRIVDCRVMTGLWRWRFLGLLAEDRNPGFGFVEFESARDAEDAVHNFNGKSFMGAKYAPQRLTATSSQTDASCIASS